MRTSFLAALLALGFACTSRGITAPRSPERFDCFGISCPMTEACETFHPGRRELKVTHSCRSYPSECKAKDCSCFARPGIVRCETTPGGGVRFTLSAP